jgi:hypothetical protein
MWSLARPLTADYGGVMGSSPDTNPDFYSWNAIFIHYCDGASMGSGRTDPIAVKDHAGKPAQLWMRGRNNFNAVIDDLLTTQGMSKATEVILSGGSAGGLAVFYNLDHLVTLLPPSVRVTGFPDAGFFMDAPGYVADFQGADPVWNVTGSGGTNANCLAAYPAAEAWKCLLAPFILEHIQADIYIMNSAYDAWQIGNNHPGCVSTASKPCNDSGVQAYGMVRVFQQKFTLEDAIGSHACSLEANTRVTNGIPLGCSLLLPVDTVNFVQTLKARRSRPGCGRGSRQRRLRAVRSSIPATCTSRTLTIAAVRACLTVWAGARWRAGPRSGDTARR